MTKSRAKMERQEFNKAFLPLEGAKEIVSCTQKIIDPINTASNNECKEENEATETLTSLEAARLEEFDRLLRESIDEALGSLGESVKNTVYQHLQNDFGIKKSEIPSNIIDFSDIIHKIFGLGATRLEIKFMMNLNLKVKIEINWPEMPEPFSRWFVTDMSFTDYVTNMRKKFVDFERAAIEP